MHGTFLSHLEFNLADHYILPRIKQFYKANGMRAQAPKGDIILIASLNAELVAALRLEPIGETLHLLRSMCVKQALRQQGVGGALLSHAQATLCSLECHTFPYSHLHDFYSRQGFIDVDESQAPEAILSRFQRYTQQGKSLCLLKHDSASMLK